MFYSTVNGDRLAWSSRRYVFRFSPCVRVWSPTCMVGTQWCPPLSSAYPPNPHRLMFVLTLKKLAFTPHFIDMKKNENRGDWYLGIDKRGIVPVLVHDGKVVVETNDILLYVAEQFPDTTPRLVPPVGDRANNALLRELLVFQESYHSDMRYLSMTKLPMAKRCPGCWRSSLRDTGGAAPTEDNAADSVANLKRILGRVDTEYATKPFLVGGAFGLADMAFWMDVRRLLSVDFPVETCLPHMWKMYWRLSPILGHADVGDGSSIPDLSGARDALLRGAGGAAVGRGLV